MFTPNSVMIALFNVMITLNDAMLWGFLHATLGVSVQHVVDGTHFVVIRLKSEHVFDIDENMLVGGVVLKKST